MEKHIQHKHFSKVDEKPILNDIVFGEIALNIAKGHEKIFFRNTNNEIIELNARKNYKNFIIELGNYFSAPYVKYFTLDTNNGERIYRGETYSNIILVPCYVTDYIEEGVLVNLYNEANYCFSSREITEDDIINFSHKQDLPVGTNTSFKVYLPGAGDPIYNGYVKSTITNEIATCDSEGTFEINAIIGDILLIGENENDLRYTYKVPSTGIPNNEIKLQ